MATVDLSHPSTADDPPHSADRGDGKSIPVNSLVESFRRDGFVFFHHALDAPLVGTLRSRLEAVLRGRFSRGSPPDKMPRPLTRYDRGEDGSGGGPLEHYQKSRSARVLQIINIHKCDEEFRGLATSPEIGRAVAELAGWEEGARLAQDQVWAKPPGAPPLVFHRDSPYFMFSPADVVTVWVALDDMREELGPLEYVRGSHRWGDGRAGSASSFFQSDNKKLLYSAARMEGIDDPESTLDIVSMAGLGAGGISIHHGKVWHGSGKNGTPNRTRRGIGLHFVPAEARLTKDARKSKLWRRYVPDDVGDDDLAHFQLPEAHFPLVWEQPR